MSYSQKIKKAVTAFLDNQIHRVRGRGTISDKQIDKDLTVPANESLVISDDITVESGSTLTLEDGASLTVM